MRKLLSLGDRSYEKKKKSDISVVIPSLGGTVLFKTILFLNKGRIKPDKILICVPKSTFPKFINIKRNSNVEIIQCPKKGQVKQKVFGFSKIKTKYTLQIDDDILVDRNCLNAFLIGAKGKSTKHAFGGFLRSKKRKISVYFFSKFADKLLNYLLYGNEGFKFRSVQKTGIPTNIFDQKNTFLSKSEWLNGILFTNTKNLLKFDYYNLEGKAYNEDVIHSGILKKNLVNFWINNRAICFEQRESYFPVNEKFNFRYWIKIYKTRKIIISYYNGSFSRMLIVMLLEIIKLVFKRIVRV